MLGKNLDLQSDPGRRGPAKGERPFIGVHFACCRTYGRIYLRTDRSAYYGHCPRCGKRLQIVTSADGSDTRFFSAY